MNLFRWLRSPIVIGAVTVLAIILDSVAAGCCGYLKRDDRSQGLGLGDLRWTACEIAAGRQTPATCPALIRRARMPWIGIDLRIIMLQLKTLPHPLRV